MSWFFRKNQKLDYSLDKLLIGRWTEIEPILGRTELDILNNYQIEVITPSNQAEIVTPIYCQLIQLNFLQMKLMYQEL